MLLRLGYAVCGTELAYTATRYWHSLCCYAMCGTGIVYAAMSATPLERSDMAYTARVWCYAMCGTDLSYGAMGCAAVCCYEFAVLARRCPVPIQRMARRIFCALSGTGIGCATTQYPVLIKRMLLRAALEGVFCEQLLPIVLDPRYLPLHPKPYTLGTYTLGTYTLGTDTLGTDTLGTYTLHPTPYTLPGPRP
eukprot:768919-Rhodomonas_salina.1